MSFVVPLPYRTLRECGSKLPAASRREVRATPTPFTHHNSPLDLGCCSCENEILSFEYELPSFEGENWSSEPKL
ncbi:hypothetical protein [Nostoc sp.]|uniref:hypothetical protein n=1 Tax=Nostoc sp. TaxID=1180 RepID=UPI002FF67E67